MPEISKQEALEYAGMDGQEVEKFEQWLKVSKWDVTANIKDAMQDAWQESAKRERYIAKTELEYAMQLVENQKTIIENLELQVASFTDNRVDLVAGERKRIIAVLCEVVVDGQFEFLKDCVEKDSK